MVATNARGAAGKIRHTAGSPAQSARIVAFPGVRSAAEPFLQQQPSLAENFLIVVDYAQPGVGYFSRLLSVTSAASVAEFAETILVSFQWPQTVDALVPTKPLAKTWSLRARRDGVLRVYSRDSHSPGTEVGDALAVGSGAVLKIGDAAFTCTVASSVPRGVPIPSAGESVDEWPGYAGFSDLDAASDQPDALLLGADFIPDDEAAGVELTHGETQPPGYPAKAVDIERVNVELAGEDPVENVLANLKPELAKLLKKYQLFQFIPLLQALDLDRPAVVDEQVAEQLADLPIEKTPKARAAAWARIIALSTLGGEDMVAETSEAFMAALAEAKDRRKAESKTAKARGTAGIYAVSVNGSNESDHGGRVDLTDAEIQSLARPTIKILATAGADSWSPTASAESAFSSGDDPNEACALLVPRRSIVERLEMYRYILQR
ncbi:hypothetical protein CRES_2112 [Corynebacterium resistens DSM 45100]|uniref:Uncharacterized protein n=1 Tax=Corynebacterium resistens (strain DSM 45100 / JCM 12819 / GTC 2026 / SICGH 158) TaxID=662755 RepID=F8E3D9_CORRG|nr:hypothetical protein [Corynebacterium resistens]AEI10465.1 hypothetical protein CRES_2112 [Corynebacterium resistens DSM 45100]